MSGLDAFFPHYLVLLKPTQSAHTCDNRLLFPHYLVLLKQRFWQHTERNPWFFPHYLVLLKPWRCATSRWMGDSLSTLFSPSETNSWGADWSSQSELSTLFSPSETQTYRAYQCIQHAGFPHYLVLLKLCDGCGCSREFAHFPHYLVLLKLLLLWLFMGL